LSFQRAHDVHGALGQLFGPPEFPEPLHCMHWPEPLQVEQVMPEVFPVPWHVLHFPDA
jgi:hypothetical protein